MKYQIKTNTTMKKVNEFFNLLTAKLDSTYFPTVKYYADNVECAKVHRTCELFNNGCMTYQVLIFNLSKACNDTTANIHEIVKEFILDFEGYVYTPTKEVIEIQFRKHKDGEIICVFPYVLWNHVDVTCYVHNGQHGACAWHINNTTKAATAEEYQDLLNELKSIYSDSDFKIIKKRNHNKYLNQYYKRQII